MYVPSAYNILIPLADSGNGSDAYVVLLNTLAGSVDIVDRRTASAVGGDLSPPTAGPRPRRDPKPVIGLSDEVLAYLDRRGYLFRSAAEEHAQARLLYGKMLDFHRASVRQPVVVIPTYSCNMHCAYCWQRLHHLDSPVMREEVAGHIFEVLPDLVDTRRPERVDLVVFGGEPLQSRPDLRERVVQLLTLGRERGFSTKVISNGTHLADHVTALRGSVDVVQVTLDGPPGIHNQRRRLPGGRDAFALIAAGVTEAVSAGMRINIRVNVDTSNLAAIPALGQLMVERGWLDSGLVRPHLAPVKNHDPRTRAYSESELLAQTTELCGVDQRMAIFDLSGFSGLKYVKGFRESGLLSLHRFFNCEAQIGFLAFDLYGDLYPCWDAAGIRDLAIGSYYPEVAVDAKRLGAWRERNALDLEGCQGCPIAPHCGGGCAFMALEHKGSLNQAFCDAMLAGYVQAVTTDARWLIERARRGDHVIGLVEGEQVRTAVRHPYGLLAQASGAEELPFNCG